MSTRRADNRPVLSLSAVTAGYGATTVLRDVSLDVGPGKIVALLGPNGAGKTTLLRVMSGLVRQSSGGIRLNGVEVGRDSAARRARAGILMIPEGRGIFPSLTVRENIAVLVRSRDRSEAIAKTIAAFPALTDRLSQVAGTLSGGQQQMVAMARCYVRPSELILIDEASMGLAPKIIDEIYLSIHNLVAEGRSLVLVEQYVDRVLEIADEVHVMQRGILRYSSPAAQVDRADLVAHYL